ncbi:unnamed protein product [Bemisia tabaci]|uniref:Uncharacterized protein n=1 Tax=Bemisia tabaci TaxID=7038 RepID=A0A9P0F454_BEMTA|nr:unnamed protein product [Bemisia tabaci]
MNPVRNHPLRLLEFCFLTLFLLTHSSSACVPLLSACDQSRECCNHPPIVCRANLCVQPREVNVKLENIAADAMEKLVNNNNLRESIKRDYEEYDLKEAKNRKDACSTFNVVKTLRLNVEQALVITQ